MDGALQVSHLTAQPSDAGDVADDYLLELKALGGTDEPLTQRQLVSSGEERRLRRELVLANLRAGGEALPPCAPLPRHQGCATPQYRGSRRGAPPPGDRGQLTPVRRPGGSGYDADELSSGGRKAVPSTPTLTRPVRRGLQDLPAALVAGVQARQQQRLAQAAQAAMDAEVSAVRSLPEVVRGVRGCLQANGKRKAMPLAKLCQLIAESPLSKSSVHEVETQIRLVGKKLPWWCAIRAAHHGEVFSVLKPDATTKDLNAAIASCVADAEHKVCRGRGLIGEGDQES